MTFAPCCVEPIVPVVEAPGGNRERDLDAEPMPELAGRRVSEREEREIGPRIAVAVGVEEVVRVRDVLIDALLHQPHAEHAGVEVEVLLRVAADAVT